MANLRVVSYRALIETRDGRTIGKVHGGKEQSDITFRISCCHGDLGPYLETKLTVNAPVAMHLPNNKYSIYSRIYSGSIETYDVHVLSDADLHDVPKAVRKTNMFDQTLLSHRLDGGKGVVKLVLTYKAADSTHEGLYNNFKFTDYFDPETDESLGKKPHIQNAINNLQILYSTDGVLTLYIRNEETDFVEEMKALWSTMEDELTDGVVIHKFYPTAAVINAEGKARVPYLQIGQQLKIEERPVVSTTATYIHRNFTEFATRKGYAAIQSMEYDKLEVCKFNDTTASMKFLTIPGGGNQKYLGVFYIDAEVDKRLQVNDTVWVSFHIHIKTSITNAEWKCQVVDPLPWMKSGEVACIAHRPREPYPEDATEEEKKIPRDFVKGRLKAGNGEVETEDQLRSELDRQRFIKVSVRLESSDQTYRRQVNAIHILQRGQKLDPTPLPGQKAAWIERPMLRNWQSRFCNKTQIPVVYTDILGPAAQFLDHLKEQDHVDVVEYLKKVPTSDSIALGLIEGRAGVGKTFMIAQITTAKLRADKSQRVMIVTPSNEPSDVVARKVAEEMQKFPDTKDLIVMRAHNPTAEKNYIVAFAKLETLTAKIESDKKKTTAELQEAKQRHALINAKKARDAAAAAQEKRKLLQSWERNLPGPRPNRRGVAGYEGYDYIVPNASEDEESDEKLDEELGDLGAVDPDLVMNNVLPALVQEFNDEVVVSEGCYKADGSIDVERLERDMTLGKVAAGLRLSQHMSTYMAPGERLVRDPRFQEIKHSLAWVVLVTVGGLVHDENAYTDHKKWATFRVLFKTFVKEGDLMDPDDRKSLDEAMKEIREYCVQRTSVLISTENNAASGLYVQNYKPSLVIGDEYNRSMITDFCIIAAHYEPNHVIMVGDTKQLKPVVIGPTPLSGFLPELEVSTLSYFLNPGWPSVSIYIQRRSRAGVMDIPIHRYYHAKAVNGPLADSDDAFPHTKKVIDLIDLKFYDKDVQRFPSMFFEIPASQAETDPITKSRYNLKQAAFVINMVEYFEMNGIPPKDQGIVTPYMAQVLVYKYAAHQLHLENPTKGWNRLLVGTADSMEGEERPVMHVDSVVTDEIGFVDDRGRMLVLKTRAKDANIEYGNTKSLYQKGRRESELLWHFNTAKSETRRICRAVGKKHTFLVHRFIQDRTQAGLKHEEEQEDKDKDMENANLLLATTEIANQDKNCKWAGEVSNRGNEDSGWGGNYSGWGGDNSGWGGDYSVEVMKHGIDEVNSDPYRCEYKDIAHRNPPDDSHEDKRAKGWDGQGWSSTMGDVQPWTVDGSW
jgi:hypothetical protein